MNLVQIGFLSLTLLALADGYLLASGGGFGGISGIFGILLLFLFIAALAKRQNIAACPANYTPTPNDPTSCIRSFSSPMKSFDEAEPACVNDGGYLLQLSTSTFPKIQELARSNSGGCSYWVQTAENADGTWYDMNFVLTPTTPGLFFLNSTNGNGGDCGLMSNAENFFIIGANCSQLHCYLCQKKV
ncbi:hypothetical protein ACJMK2_021619 [Sinanodonta woodiana]|uniref:C-type lectin domain-containing protein n=1 Tax=Sinanodonta woodiana TaxID=1069815 RepID=A0ABD3TGL3_SINWO